MKPHSAVAMYLKITEKLVFVGRVLANVCEELPSLVLEPEQHERVPRAQRPLRGLHVPRGHRTHARRPLAHALPAVHGSRTPPQVTVLRER